MMRGRSVRQVDPSDINRHLHCGAPPPLGVRPATIKAPHAITRHPNSRAKMHRPAWAIVFNYGGELHLGARFLCGSASQSVTAVVDPGSEPLCHKCEAVASRTVVVYGYFDADDTPLYVGQSKNLRERHMAHRTGSKWFAQVADMAILSEHDNVQDALVAEALAIAGLQPQYNVRQNLSLLRGGAA